MCEDEACEETTICAFISKVRLVGGRYGQDLVVCSDKCVVCYAHGRKDEDGA